ncbi:MAG TPA: class I SAM-dependent methyltransferase [Acidobacteriota bacterium]|nr:class I SAM-dependent methyltransferase [Acidobacteriota bacterium]
MKVCTDCGFVYNEAFDEKVLMYGMHYDNTQSHSPYFAHYLEKLATYLINEKGVRNSRIVEVGCGKGTFLRMLIAAREIGNSGYGFDPSYVGPDSDLDGRLKFERRNYGPECARVPADIVICRHVIEHVPDPLELLYQVRQALDSSTHGRIFFETPCVEWILRNKVIWDFFHEHCSLFSADSLTTGFQRAGFQVDNVRWIFCGQYLWIEASVPADRPDVRKRAGEVPALAKQFALSEENLKSSWLHRIRALRAKGKIAIWGAGAKGAAFANLIDPGRELIDCIVDLNPSKQGHYLPGTGHPIVGHRDLKTRNIAYAILMNPNYREENLALLQEAAIDTSLIE